MDEKLHLANEKSIIGSGASSTNGEAHLVERYSFVLYYSFYLDVSCHITLLTVKNKC